MIFWRLSNIQKQTKYHEAPSSHYPASAIIDSFILLFCLYSHHVFLLYFTESNFSLQIISLKAFYFVSLKDVSFVSINYMNGSILGFFNFHFIGEVSIFIPIPHCLKCLVCRRVSSTTSFFFRNVFLSLNFHINLRTTLQIPKKQKQNNLSEWMQFTDNF